jgi:hypothetical protein
MQAVLQSRVREEEFFATYLQDRIFYSRQLGLTDRLPRARAALLRIGDDITWDHIETLLAENGQLEDGSLATETTDAGGNPVMIIGSHVSSSERRWLESEAKAKGMRVARPTEVRASAPAFVLVEEDGGTKVMVLNPGLCPSERKQRLRQAKAKGMRIGDPDDFPTIRGHFAHAMDAEQYPTIRWSFQSGKYVVVGVPDGITDQFVYEFKSCKNSFLMNYQKPVALTQADLYGYFFRRDKKRVQIHIKDGERTETWEDPVNKANAERTLRNFARVDGGWIPPAPKPWKCKTCEFREDCAIGQK